MSKKFRSQASSTRAATSLGGFGSFSSSVSPLSYIAEPPDLSQVSDPNVVVNLKNLSKRDSTTKGKALEELLDVLKDGGDVPVLTAWSDLYPRTAIDNSHVVRRLAHTLQGVLASKAGKTIAPFLTTVIPAWLAGVYDSDKSVSKAAIEAFERTFANPEKRVAVWTIYKDSIYDRIEDSILTQSSTTLSDERTTSPDEANTKYVRVVGTALRLLRRLLEVKSARTDILQDKKLWDLASHDDAYLRTGLYEVASTALTHHKDDLDWGILSTSLLYKALHRAQLGCAKVYAQMLIDVTEARPTIWTTDYTAKTSAAKRLLQYLRLGSQSGPAEVWPLLTQLVATIPVEAWLHGAEDLFSVADAFRTGVLLERLNIDHAWAAYLNLCSHLLTLAQTSEEKASFLSSNIVPLIVIYFTQKRDEKWQVAGRIEATAEKAIPLLTEQSSVLETALKTVIDDTIEKMRLSLPESSKDFRLSQDTVAAQGQRLVTLGRYMSSEEAKTLFARSSSHLIEAAIDLLKTRNGKPYGAASILEQLVNRAGQKSSEVDTFLSNDAKALLDSPSGPQIVALSLSNGRSLGLDLLQYDTNSPAIINSLICYFQNVSREELEQSSIKDLVIERVDNSEDEISRRYTVALLGNTGLRGGAVHLELLSRLPEDLSTKGEESIALAMLEAIVDDRLAVQVLEDSKYRLQLLSKLLLLADQNDEFSDRATVLVARLKNFGKEKVSPLPIIKEQLSGRGTPLAILTLVELALESSVEGDVVEYLPSSNDWEAALRPHLQGSTDTSLSITSPLRGTVILLEAGSAQTSVIRDAEDFSLLFRLIFYTTKLLSRKHELLRDSPPVQALYRYYPITVELINEKLTLDDANSLWLDSNTDVETAASDILSESLHLLEKWQDQEEFMRIWVDEIQHLNGLDRSAYMKALALQTILSRLNARSPPQVVQLLEDQLRNAHKSHNILLNAAILSAIKDTYLASQAGLRLVNEYVALATQAQSEPRPVILLNILLSDDVSVLEKVQQPRLILLLKKLIQLAGQNEMRGQSPQCLELIATLVEPVRHLYGEHWEQLVQLLVSVWSDVSVSDLPSLYGSLLVYSKLGKLLKEDGVNEDLQDIMAARQKELEEGLLSCLQLFRSPVYGTNQPRSIVINQLSRQVRTVDVSNAQHTLDLLAAKEKTLQDTAYDILHRQIPAKQEQLSIDLALEQHAVHLPPELLALVADNADPRRYLLSWKLLFDHYPKASYRLQEAYTADVKSSGQLGLLLDFICDRIQLTSNRPVDATKFEIAEYTILTAESEDQEIQWLAIHVYFLCLVYVPALVKEWYIQQKNKIKMPLESWTQKYMSSLIVAANFITVDDWAVTQSNDESERPLEVKSNPRAAEIVASIPVDPESPPISLSIKFPDAYPLESPSVVSRTRVGVSEKNWTSWLRTIQIIIFSTGSVIEGLIAFRRNVRGALSGQTECAICYSIIGTDMQTPSKKCGTCKNMFHGACLFRWFRSSNSSSCPLCRNNFNYA